MSATKKYSELMRRARKDLLDDASEDGYRVKDKSLIGFFADSIDELCETLNPWARFSQETGELLPSFNSLSALSVRDMTEAEASVTVSGGTATPLSEAMNSVIPVDDRFAKCLVYLASSKAFETDDSDTVNLQKVQFFRQMAERFALS